MYTYKGFKFYVEDNAIIIEAPNSDGAGDILDEIPVELIKFSVVRKAIYLAYTNFGDENCDTIYRIIHEQASIDDANKIEKILNKYGDSIYNY